MASYEDTVIREESEEKIKTVTDILEQKLGPNWRLIISLILIALTIIIIIVISV